METNRQKKIGSLLQNDLVDILQGEIRKNGITNLVISVTQVMVTSDLSVAKVYLSVFPNEKGPELLEAIKSNTVMIRHQLAIRVKNQLRRVPNLVFFTDDTLEVLDGIEKALKRVENPIFDRDLLEKRKFVGNKNI
ncbi:MAG: 30S ribosome-binding factor RbfA [Flavobacterium sp.]|jgi:ribosome-binding factor A